MFIPGMIYRENNSYDLYVKKVKNISKLMDELDLNNIHEIFYTYCYLLWNGYFSENKKYIYAYKNITNEDLTIFLGRGCCRHNAKLLKDVILFMNTYNCLPKSIGVYLEDTTRIKSLTGIKREISEIPPIQLYENSLDNEAKTNHKVTIVSDEGIILLDPTSPVECSIIDGKKIVCPNGKYRVNKKILEEELSISYTEQDIKRKSKLTKDKLIESYELAKELLNRNKSLIEDFYDSSRNNLEEIKKYVYR